MTGGVPSDPPGAAGAAAAVHGRVPLRTKLAFGFGAIAYGIKDNGFAVFLLIYFNQVVGMPAAQVGLAVLIALIADAIFDPIVGHLSDRTDTRWGRRHPWLYASALPIVLSWILLWNPPEWDGAMLFGYLLFVAMAVRMSFSAYEVPTLAILPELTRDYDERTEVLRYRFLFGWGGGLTMLYLTYAFILVPAPGSPDGLLNPQGYHIYGLVGAAIMLIAVLVSAIGTHRLIAKPVDRSQAGAQHVGLGEIWRTLAFPPFLILLIAGTFAFANQGLLFALTNYLLIYVWGFSQLALTIYPAALFLGVVMAFLIVGPLSRRFEKPMVAIAMAIAASLIGTLPYWLHALGVLGSDGGATNLVILMAAISIGTGFGICVMILLPSMIADITDASEARTGRRSEGLFFAGFFFMQKCVGGLGILLSAMVLALAGFPDDATPGAVDPAVIDRLVILFAAATLAIGLLCAFTFTRFTLSRDDHSQRLREIGERPEADPQ